MHKTHIFDQKNYEKKKKITDLPTQQTISFFTPHHLRLANHGLVSIWEQREVIQIYPWVNLGNHLQEVDHFLIIPIDKLYYVIANTCHIHQG